MICTVCTRQATVAAATVGNGLLNPASSLPGPARGAGGQRHTDNRTHEGAHTRTTPAARPTDRYAPAPALQTGVAVA